jgi:alpha-mannosidase
MGREVWGRQRECQGWIAADGDGWGVVIGSDRRAFEVEGGTLRGDLLRSIPAEASQDYRLVWRTYPPEVVARYSLRSYAGDWRSARAWRDGWALNNPMVSRSVNDTATPKSLPPRMSFCGIDGEERVLIPALKRAEDGEGVVVRAFDPAGEAWEGGLRLCREMGEVCETNMLEERIGEVDPRRVAFRPFEIKTFRIKTL